MNTFQHRLNKLGFNSYTEYLNSEHWESFRNRYYSTYSKRCRGCDGTYGISLHHTTYERLGCEQLGDVIPLCSKCHDKVHKLIKYKVYKLDETNEIIDRIRNKANKPAIVNDKNPYLGTKQCEDLVFGSDNGGDLDTRCKCLRSKIVSMSKKMNGHDAGIITKGLNRLLKERDLTSLTNRLKDAIIVINQS